MTIMSTYRVVSRIKGMTYKTVKHLAPTRVRFILLPFIIYHFLINILKSILSSQVIWLKGKPQ